MNAMDKLTREQESALHDVQTSELQAITGGSATSGAGSGKMVVGALPLPVDQYQLVSTVSNLL